MRPDDFHMAMRADLVCILKDVVGLIARIEASISDPSEHRNGPHKPAPASETPMKAGSDAKAAHSCVVGAAPEVSDDRPPQPIPDQPTAAALPPSVDPAAPPAALSNVQRPAPQEAPKPILIPKAQAKPKSKPLDPRPGKLVGVVIDAPGTVLALDMKQLVAVGPKGDWDIGTRPVALIMERMRNGETFGDDVLAELGSMGTDTFRESRKRWAGELAKVGVTFIHTKGVGCRIEVAQ